MPNVSFLSDGITIEVASGTTIQEAVEMGGAGLPFGCRKGSCGTCRCLIELGAENLNPMTAAERELFGTLTAVAPSERLGCQLVILGDVAIRA